MTQGFTIYGDVTAEQILSALKSLLPDRDINIVPSYRPNKNAHSHSNHSINNNELIITTLSDDKKRVEELESKLNSKQKELIEVEEACNKATLSIQTFHKQQQALFDEFVLLRQRYDEQKTTLLTILWKHCASCHPDLREIPPAEDEETFKETDSEVGNLIVGELLGEGQFATVRVCQRKGEEKSYALKVIKKERITSFTSLLRVSNEIASLKNLKSEYIVSVTDVIQTTSKLYIVTEKGGFDLFEFFDEHPDGVPEKWAKQIMTCIMKGVVYCHSHSVCHRDLKPENILLTFDAKKEQVIDLKLCDFGLSTKFQTKVLLTDFCGSPGFFAPEMIISGTYYGDKADIWSVGCILLELMLGHEKFCDIWMTTYDYDILQDKEKFTEEIHATLDSLPDMLNFTEELNDFILKFLQIRSSIRPTAVGISAHTWLDGSMDDILSSLRASKLSVDTHANRPFTPPNLSPSPSISDMASSKNYQVDPETLKAAYNNLSERERRHIEEYILNQKDGAKNSDHQIHLPPIEPATPSLGNARKIMKKGDELASKASLENPQQFTFESHVIAQSPKSSSPSNSGFNSPMTSQRLSRTSSAMKTPLPGVSEVEVMTFSEELKTTTRKSSDAVLKSASERSSPKAFISSNSEKAFGKDDK